MGHIKIEIVEQHKSNNGILLKPMICRISKINATVYFYAMLSYMQVGIFALK